MTAAQETRLRYLYSPSGEANHPHEEVLSVYRDHGVIPKSSRSDNFNKTPDNIERYLLVRPGDLVVNRMKAWQGSLGVSDHRGIVSGDYEVLRPASDSVSGRYMHYALRSRHMVGEYRVRSTGIRPSQWRLYWDQMGDIRVSLPPLEKQERIAAYLDAETSQIDTLITEQQRLVEMLRERRISVLRSAISGVACGGSIGGSNDWFGSLPEGWGAAPIRRHFSVNLGKMLNANKDEVEGAEAPYLAAGSIQPETLLLDEPKTMTFSSPELEHYSLRSGDVVVVEGGAGYGRSHYLRQDLPGWGFQNHVARLRSSTGLVDGLFATYCLKACLASGHIEANNRTATIPSLSRDVLGAIRIPVPPASDQRQIAKYLEEQTARIDTLIAESERLVELSQERRAALITAAVTGQIDV
ncbi:restriction endonuclease subunit S [Streptomyces virginiae]|uniref:restriction endonuclease subunit S n=1 Tax=Streptomyces virginiae TaxID=1961 RepID=UPI0036CE2E13